VGLVRGAGRRSLVAALALLALVACAPQPTASPGANVSSVTPVAPTSAGSSVAAPPSPSPAPTAVASGIAPTTAASSPVATAPAPSGSPDPYRVVRLPADGVVSLPLEKDLRIHRWSTSGSRVVFDEAGYGGDAGWGRRIWLADLAAGTLRVLATSADGDGATDPVLDGGRVAWIEARYLGDNVWLTGPCAWRVVVLDPATGRRRVLASGTNNRVLGQNAPYPKVALRGDRLAYSVEAPGAAGGYAIVVRDVATGAVRRTLPAGGYVFDLALAADDAVVWTEGTPVPDQVALRDTHLRLARGGAASVVLADAAYELDVVGDRVAWIADVPASETGIGGMLQPRVWTSTLGRWAPRDIMGPDAPGALRFGYYPAIGDGFVTWAEEVAPNVGLGDQQVVVWDSRSGVVSRLEPTESVVIAAVGGGWLLWYDMPSGEDFLRGIPLRALDLP
jgi:hypothetical protein